MQNNYLYSNQATGNHNWYVVKCNPGKEFFVFDNLVKRIKEFDLSDISAVFVPVENRVVLRNSQRKIMENPQIPGYIYIRAFMSNRIVDFIQTPINTKTGKKLYPRFVVNDRNAINGVSPISRSEVLRIENMLNDDTPVAVNDAKFRIHDQVVIHSGEFKNFNGTISAIDGDEAIVAVKIFNRSTPLRIGLENLALT